MFVYRPKDFSLCFEAEKKVSAQDEARSQRHDNPPPLPPPQQAPPPDPEVPEEELPTKSMGEFPDCQPTPRMRVHKHCVSIVIEKVTRKFSLSAYGCEQLAMLAGSHYESLATSKLFEFEKLAKKPAPRHDFLVIHGWDTNKDSKRNLAAQRSFVLTKMAGGHVKYLEDAILERVQKTLLPGVKADLKLDGSGFSACWTCDSQQVHKTFKTLRGAVVWVQEMEQSKKVGPEGIFAHVYIYTCLSIIQSQHLIYIYTYANKTVSIQQDTTQIYIYTMTLLHVNIGV